MANYVGVHCPVCNKRFVDDDDIVVCPICGAPHHRACYDVEHRCALSELHIKGHTWQPPEPPPETRQESQEPQEAGACSACGAKNPPSGIFCSTCGAPLGRRTEGVHAGANAYTAAFGGVAPDEKIGGVAVRDIALYVGENSRYFLPRFKHLSEKGGVLPNFGAFFFNFLYYFYRKMYLVGGVMLGVFLLSQIPAFFIAPEYAQYVFANIEDMMMGITPPDFVPTLNLWAYTASYYIRYAVMGAGLVFSLFANKLYMNLVLANVRKIKLHFESAEGGWNDSLYTQELTRRGRTSRLAVVLCVAGLMIGFTVACNVLAAMLPPIGG